MMKNSIIMTIDWEDFGQLYTWYKFNEILPPKSNIDRQTSIMLELFDKYEIKTTFFILGMLAKYKPDLVKKIASCGHEIALHGMNHESLQSLNESQIKEDISTSKDLISQIIGQPILGYRAPFFSLTKDRLFVLKILSDLGFLYDSSIFPASWARYYIQDFPSKFQNYRLDDNLSIVELPMTTYPVLNKKVGVTGGGYLRLIPKYILKKVVKSLYQKEKFTMLYLHPYEFDTTNISIEAYKKEGYKFNDLNRNINNWRWNLFRAGLINKLNYIFGTYYGQFSTCADVARVIKNQPKVNIIK